MLSPGRKRRQLTGFVLCQTVGGFVFSSSECLRVQSLALGVGDSSWGCLVFGGIFELNAPKIAIFIQKSFRSDEWRWCWIDLDGFRGELLVFLSKWLGSWRKEAGCFWKICFVLRFHELHGVRVSCFYSCDSFGFMRSGRCWKVLQ